MFHVAPVDLFQRGPESGQDGEIFLASGLFLGGDEGLQVENPDGSSGVICIGVECGRKSGYDRPTANQSQRAEIRVSS